MKLFDTVAIVCDYSLVELATAIRAPLAAMNLHVRLYKLVQYQQAISFFANEARLYNYIIMCCHGAGIEEAEMMIRVEVMKQKDNDPERDEGWEATVLELRPSNILELIRDFKGNILSLGCGSGREPFGKAFLEAGCQNYIAPQELFFSRDSGMLFAISFFYHLLAEDRDFDREKLEITQAVKLAQQSDPRFSMGTLSFRCYSNP